MRKKSAHQRRLRERNWKFLRRNRTPMTISAKARASGKRFFSAPSGSDTRTYRGLCFFVPPCRKKNARIKIARKRNKKRSENQFGVRSCISFRSQSDEYFPHRKVGRFWRRINSTGGITCEIQTSWGRKPWLSRACRDGEIRTRDLLRPRQAR